MAFVGGDVIEVSYSHPTLGTGKFYPKAGEDNTYDLGGFRGNDDANMIAGNGESIRQLNRVRGFFECVYANDMNTKQDYEQACALAADPVEATWTFTGQNGVVYTMIGSPVGDIQPNINQATFTMKVMGTVLQQVR